jgi:hypothetical protein
MSSGHSVRRSFAPLDRLTTWEDVTCAMLSSSRCTIELAGRRDDSSEMDSDFSGRTGNLSEEDMWLAFASEVLVCCPINKWQ